MKDKPSPTQVYDEAVRQWGIDNQLFMLLEEMAELQVAISKLRRERNRFNMDRLVDELADVELMIEQVKHIWLLEDKVARRREVKLDRLIGLLGFFDPEIPCRQEIAATNETGR